MSKVRKVILDEFGSETIQFLGLLPILMMVGIVIVQVFMGGQALLLTVGAAREGARAASVCGDYNGAVRNAIGGIKNYQVYPSYGGDDVSVRVEAEIPVIFRQLYGYQGALVKLDPISFTSTMPKDKNRCGPNWR